MWTLQRAAHRHAAWVEGITTQTETCCIVWNGVHTTVGLGIAKLGQHERHEASRAHCDLIPSPQRHFDGSMAHLCESPRAVQRRANAFKPCRNEESIAVTVRTEVRCRTERSTALRRGCCPSCAPNWRNRPKTHTKYLGNPNKTSSYSRTTLGSRRGGTAADCRGRATGEDLPLRDAATPTIGNAHGPSS